MEAHTLSQCLYVLFLSVLKMLYAHIFSLWCMAHMWLHTSIGMFRVSTLLCDIQETQLTPVCKVQLSTVTQLIHLWAKNHQHQTHLHRHHSGVVYLPPRVVLHLSHTTHPNLTCFPQGGFFWGEGGVRQARWDGIGWGRVGLGGVVCFQFLFSFSFPSTLFPLCVSI